MKADDIRLRMAKTQCSTSVPVPQSITHFTNAHGTLRLYCSCIMPEAEYQIHAKLCWPLWWDIRAARSGMHHGIAANRWTPYKIPYQCHQFCNWSHFASSPIPRPWFCLFLRGARSIFLLQLQKLSIPHWIILHISFHHLGLWSRTSSTREAIFSRVCSS